MYPYRPIIISICKYRYAFILISDSNWLYFDPSGLAVGLEVECEKRGVNDSKVYGLSTWKDGVVINRAVFWVEFRSSVLDWLSF